MSGISTTAAVSGATNPLAEPEINGTVGAEEWANAACDDFTVPLTGGRTTRARICLMHDDVNWYWSVRSERPLNNAGDVVRILLRSGPGATFYDEIHWAGSYTDRYRSGDLTASLTDAQQDGSTVRSGASGYTSFEGFKPRFSGDPQDLPLTGIVDFRLEILQGATTLSYPGAGWGQYDFGQTVIDTRQKVIVTVLDPLGNLVGSSLVTVVDPETGEYWTEITGGGEARFYFAEDEVRRLIVHARNLDGLPTPKEGTTPASCDVSGFFFALSPHRENCFLNTLNTAGRNLVGQLHKPSSKSSVPLLPINYSALLEAEDFVLLPGIPSTVIPISIQLQAGVTITGQVKNPFTGGDLTVITNDHADGENLFVILGFGNLTAPRLPPGLEQYGYLPKGILHTITQLTTNSPTVFSIKGVPPGLQLVFESNDLTTLNHGQMQILQSITTGNSDQTINLVPIPAVEGEQRFEEPCNDSRDQREICGPVLFATGVGGEMVVSTGWRGVDKRNRYRATLEVNFLSPSGSWESILTTAECALRSGSTTEWVCRVHEVRPSHRAGMAVVGGFGARDATSVPAGTLFWQIALPAGATQARFQIRAGDSPSWVDHAPNDGFQAWEPSSGNTWITPF